MYMDVMHHACILNRYGHDQASSTHIEVVPSNIRCFRTKACTVASTPQGPPYKLTSVHK